MKKYAAALVVGAAGLVYGTSVVSNSTNAPSHVCHYQAGGALPDPACTPGVTNSAVTQATINRTICVRGWTATIRPSAGVTGPEKLASMRQYGVSGSAGYEYDHLISLELGGAANDTRNLWPEPHLVMNGGRDEGSFVKDGIENRLKRDICAGRITLLAAQSLIRSDWRKASP